MSDLLPPAVELRLRRAQEHITVLRRILSEYADTPPFHVTTRAADEPPLLVDHAELTREPPKVAAMLVSDAVHQARAALDNLVNALRDGGPSRSVYFPIRETEREFRAAVANGALHRVPDVSVAAIRALQPFETQDPRRWAGDQLLNLHNLARIDRHRLPPIHAAVVLPDYATSDGQNPPSASLDRVAWRWAEWTYDPAHVNTRSFRVEVLFGPEAEQPDGVDVADWVAYLINRATFAIETVVASK